MRYPIIIHHDKAGYGITIPDVPGCFTAGDTLEEALENVREALEAHLGGEDNLPEPSSVVSHFVCDLIGSERG